MAKENKGGVPQGGGAPVVQLPSSCAAEGCKSKVARSGFCNEHFTWFKEGLLTRQGEKPKDFDKKYQLFLQKSKKVA